MDDWTRARTSWLQTEPPEHRREAGFDFRRRDEALSRADAAHEKALVEGPGELPAVVALRQEWARAKAARLLEERGYDVTCCDDGADALGTAAALQPALLLCEEPLASVATPDLVAWVTRLSPQTRVLVQVQHARDVDRALAAGAAVAVTRTTSIEALLSTGVR